MLILQSKSSDSNDIIEPQASFEPTKKKKSPMSLVDQLGETNSESGKWKDIIVLIKCNITDKSFIVTNTCCNIVIIKK